MRKRLSPRVEMMRNVIQNFYKEKKEIIEQYSGINDLFKYLRDTIIKDIDDVSLKQSNKSVGITIDKNKVKYSLCSVLNLIVNPAYLVASNMNDEDLKILCDCSETDFRRMKAEDLVIKANSIYNNTFPLLDNLKPFGIKSEDFELFDECIKNYEKCRYKPFSALKTRKLYSQQQNELVWEGVKFMETQLDKSMNIFKTKNEDLFYSYKVQRRLPNTGERHEGLMVSIKDKITKKSISGADVEVPNKYIDQLKKSNKRGSVYFDLIIEGEYIVTIIKEGYKTYIAPIIIEKNKRTVLKVLMEKI